jgi:hypothetical protein
LCEVILDALAGGVSSEDVDHRITKSTWGRLPSWTPFTFAQSRADQEEGLQ